MTHSKMTVLYQLMVLLGVLTFAVFTTGAGCPIDDDDDATGDDDTADDDTADDDTSGDDDVVEPFSVTGTLYAVPVFYEQDETGTWARHELEWTDVNEDGYNLGLFYTALTQSQQNMNNPFVIDVPTAVPADPKNEGTPFTLVPEADGLPLDLEQAYVMAAADSYHDTILSSRDAMVFYPEPLSVLDGPVEDITLVMDLEFKWCDAWVVGYHGEGCGGGCGNSGTIELSGQTVLHGTTHTTEVGASMIAIYSEGGGGPWWVTKPGDMDGANQDDYLPWELTTCGNFTAQILGAWDWNNNLLFEPTDDWGITVDGVGGDVIHEWELEGENVGDLLVRMPESFGIPLRNPYVRITGVVNTDGSFAFADLPDEASLGVLASKDPEFGGEGAGGPPTLPELIAQGVLWSYDQTPNVNQAGDEIPFELWVKPYSTAYLRAGIDLDDDGHVDPEYVSTVIAIHIENTEVNTVLTMSHGG